MKIPQTNTLVSIVIVTYNSKDYILTCIRAIYKSRYRKIEVIVVDNNSNDETTELISHYFPKVKIIKSNKNLGYAGGNNLGVSYAKGKYIAVINPDTQVSPNWLEPLIKGLEEKDICICQPKIMLLKNKKLINCSGKITHFLGFEWLKDYKRKDHTMQKQFIDSFSGSIFLTTKSFFIESKGFDDLFFMYYEDGDLSWRARLLGKKILFIPASIAYHDYKYIPNENYQKSRQKFYFLERNRLLMLLKNYSITTLILLLPAIIFMELGMVIYFLSKGWLLDKLNTYIWLIRNSKEIRENRSDIQKARKISDKELCQNFAAKIDYEELNNPFLSLFINPLLGLYWGVIKIII